MTKTLNCLLVLFGLAGGAFGFGEMYLKPHPAPTPIPKPVEDDDDTTTDPVVDHADAIAELRTALGGLAIKHDADLDEASAESLALRHVIADYKNKLEIEHERGDEFATQLQDFSDRLDAIPGDVAGDDCRLLLEDVKQRQKLLLHAFDLFGRTGKYFTEDCTYNHPTPCTTPAWRGN